MPAKVTASIVVLQLFEGLQARLDSAPEPKPEVLKKDIRDVQEIVYQLRDQMLKKAKELPHRPGGASPRLDPPKKKQACQIIGTLMGQGDTLSEAVTAVAKRFEVSEKTIRRAWQELHRRKREG